MSTPGLSPLPRLLVLTDRTQTGGRPLREVVTCAAEGGATCVILREKDLADEDRAALAAELRPLVPILLMASTTGGEPAAGVHLSSTDEFPDPRPAIVGRSCHSLAELDAAAAEGCDYATLSPIFESASKPGYGPALGVEALAGARLPVYALGGVDSAATAAACRAAGAAGVASMGHVMRAEDPAVAVRDLLP